MARTCIITLEFPPMQGGIATASWRLAKYLKQIGLEVHVFTVGHMKQGPFSHERVSLDTQEEDGVYVHRMSPYSGTLTRVPPQEIQNFIHFIELLHDRYHFHFFHGIRINPSGYIAVLLSRRFQKRSIVSVRGNDIGRDIYDTSLYHRIKFTLENCHEATFVNLSLFNLANLHFDIENKSHVIMNSVRSEDFREEKVSRSELVGDEGARNHFLIGFVGTVRRKKGFAYLLEAFRKFARKHKAKLVIIGDLMPDERASYLSMIEQSGVKEHIIITGYVPHNSVLSYIRHLDVFVLPSVSEGCPNALLEAMYCERCCLVTDKGNMDSVIKDNHTGLVMGAHSAEEIFNALEKAYSDPDLVERLGKAAKRDVAQKFRPQKEKEAWKRVYGLDMDHLPSLATAETGKVSEHRYLKYLSSLYNQRKDLFGLVPLEVEIELSFVCNLDCMMCDKNRLVEARRKKDRDFFDKFSCMDEPEKWERYYFDREEVTTFEALQGILDHLSSQGVKALLFTGGEPLLHPHFKDILAYASKQGFNLSVVTNGTLVDSEIVRVLVTSGARIYISLDGATAETHDSIRGVPGTFNRVMKAIDQFNHAISTQDERATLGLRFVVMHKNIKEIPLFFRLAIEKGIEDFSFELVSGEFHNMIRGDDYQRLKHVLSDVVATFGYPYVKEKIYWIDNILTESVKEESLAEGKPQKDLFLTDPQTCFFACNSCLINAYGDVYPCGYTINPSNNMGNITKYSLGEIWRGGKYNEFRYAAAPVDLTRRRFYSCGDCELHQSFYSIRERLKRILLINPSYQPHWSKCEPTGLMQLASSLESAGFSVTIIDLNVKHMTLRDISKYVYSEAPLLIGIGALTLQSLEAYEIGNYLKKHYPYIHIVYGGVHPSTLPREPFDKGEADFVLVGEGDNSIVELSRYLLREGNKSLQDIRGIVYRNEGELVFNESESPVKVDALPLPAYHLIDLSRYNTNIHVKPYDKEQAVHMMTSRGCPFNCAFCSVPYLYSRKVRFQSVHKVISHLKYVKYELGISCIHFHDDVFLLDVERVRELARRINSLRLGIKWICLASVSEILNAESVLPLMSEAGCVGIEFGVESGDEKVLQTMGKEQDISDIKKASKILRDNGIEPLYLMISYLPEENIDSPYKSARLLFEMITQQQVQEHSPLPKYEASPYIMGHLARASPGSSFYDTASRKGIILAKGWNEHFEETMGFIPYSLLYDTPEIIADLTYKDLLKRIRDSNLKHYVEKSFYTPASVNALFQKSLKRYIEALFNVYQYCKSDNRVKDILESAKERFGYTWELITHCICMLSILRVIRSSRKHMLYVEAIKQGKALPASVVPNDVEIEVTYHCNLGCKMCDVRRVSNCKGDESILSKYSHLDSVQDFVDTYISRREVMDSGLLKRLFSEFSEMGIGSVALSGGEPLLHPQIKSIISAAHSFGLGGSVFTNGTVMDDETAELLMKLNWKVSLSIDGSTKEIHDAIRCTPGAFDKAMANLEKLQSFQKAYDRGKIELHCTLQKENSCDIVDFFEFAAGKGVKEFDFDLVTSEFSDRMDEESYRNIFYQLERVKERYPHYHEHIPWLDTYLDGSMEKEDIIGCTPRKSLFEKYHVTCYYCCDSVNINPFGDVFPCCYTFNPSSIMGNVMNNSFKEIFYGKKFDDFRSGLSPVTFNSQKYQSCKYCALHHVFQKMDMKMRG